MNTITKQELVKKEFNLDLYSAIFYHIEQMIWEIDSPLVDVKESYNEYYSRIHLEDLKSIIESYNQGYSTEERYEFWGVEKFTLDNFNETDACYDIKDECYVFNAIEIYNEAGLEQELIFMTDGIGDVTDLDGYTFLAHELDRYTFLTCDEIITKLLDLFKKDEDYTEYEDKINYHIQQIKEIKKEYADYYN